MDTAAVLVVDDEHLVRWALRQRLEQKGYHVDEAETGAQALRRFAEGTDLVLLDYRLPDSDGIDILRRMKAADPSPAIIMLTAHSSVENAVQAMRAGAFFYASKSADLDHVTRPIAEALEATRLHRESRALRKSGDHPVHDRIMGDSPAMRHVKALLEKIAASPASTVLITGESGTGKDLAAKAIHHCSQRADGPLLNINCSALPPTLLESELFGHERGAFTDAKNQKKGLLELANGGTVFLDEIGEMEPAVQAKLLRFLEEKNFRRVGGAVEINTDVRVVAATNVDLRDAMRRGAFREDLFYRLAVLTVPMPPLRERGADIELLVTYFLDRFASQFAKPVRGVQPGAMRFLASYAWPGNVRELRNATERAVLLAENDILGIEDFFESRLVQQPAGASHTFCLPPEGIDLHELERHFVVQALERCDGNQTRAAALLGMNRDQVRYRIEKFGLVAKESSGPASAL